MSTLPLSLIFTILFTTLSLTPPSRASCLDSCGQIPIKFPLGSSLGCGHPSFSPYIQCLNKQLLLQTPTGEYPIVWLNYQNATLLVSDPQMSTCATMQNSGSFGLGPSMPFMLDPNDRFALLGCSSSSPVFDMDAPLCDTEGSHMCNALYKCEGISGIGLEPDEVSTCCVYEPIGLGPSRQLNLPGLQCSSYTSVYSYGGDEEDARKWRYGISLKYSVGQNDTYDSSACEECERSDGACGFGGPTQSFLCVCRNGINTTLNCYGQGYAWSGTPACWTGNWNHILSTCLVLFYII
ncbi:hypothetical protein AMTRI_Chr10g225980 [Amborella trichopoda]